MARRRKIKPHYLTNMGLSLLVLAVFGLAGAKVVGQSSAATANPYGYADYCALENNTTVIYGWASDPNATSLSQPSVTINAGGKAITVDTNRAGYRDAPINKWIDTYRAGDPKPGTYGFRAPIAGLYKGGSYTITGTALNEGAGSSTILGINNSAPTDGGSQPYFAGSKIPQACLASAPAPPAPAPAPAPAPLPRPVPAPSPAPSHNGTGSTPAVSTTKPGQPSNALDAAVTTGTLAASVVIPADNATAIHIIYGTNPVQLDQSTPDQTVSGDSATVNLTGLLAKTNYSYQIVRSTAGQTVNSATAGFTTLGYSIAMHFVDGHDKGIQGISAHLDDSKVDQKSDDSGNLFFDNVATGAHTVWYTYGGKISKKSVNASADTVSPDEAAAPKVVTVNYTVNLQDAPAAAQAQKKDASPWAFIVPLCVVVIAIVLGVIGYTRRRRRSSYQDYYEDFPSMGLPGYERPAPKAPPVEPLPPMPAVHTVPKPENAQHIGESLKDMVLRSMAEEAKKRDGDSGGSDKK